MINIIGTIYDNSSLHTVALANQIKDEEYKDGTKKQSQINQEFDERIDAMSAYYNNNKGLYNSPTSLREEQPEPEVGDWAIVVENDKLIIWGCNIAGQWSSTQQEYQQELPDLEDYITDEQLSTTLNQYVTKQYFDQHQPTIHGGDGVNHIFTTLEEYQALTSYQDNAIYFILEPEVKTNWTFGGTFPVVLAGEGLGTFPITLR